MQHGLLEDRRARKYSLSGCVLVSVIVGTFSVGIILGFATALGKSGAAPTEMSEGHEGVSAVSLARGGKGGGGGHGKGRGGGHGEEEHGGEDDDAPNLQQHCASDDFRDRTLKTVTDASFFGLLPDIHQEQIFEASSVMVYEHGFMSVCDSSWEIPVIHSMSGGTEFTSIYNPNIREEDRWVNQVSGLNYLVLPNDTAAFPSHVDSQWEAMTYDTLLDHHVTVQESVQFSDEKFRAIIMVIDIIGQADPVASQFPTWRLVKACPSEKVFADASKGFEGALGMEGIDGRFFLLGLCEGNYCDTGRRGKERGNGRLVVMELDNGTGPPNEFQAGQMQWTSTCKWTTVLEVDLPSKAHFMDYSDIARRGNTLAVSSQEDSALFLGNMVLTEDGLLDPATFAVRSAVDVVYFPPAPGCELQYCNLEAIDFVGDRFLIGGSDRMKGRGKQGYNCLAKDQSLHAFALPKNLWRDVSRSEDEDAEELGR